MKTVLLSKIRIISIVVAMVMIVGTICSLHTIPSNGTNTARSYKVFKASTAEEIGTYSLTVEHGEQPSPRAVIGNDDREIDWTKSGVVKICGYDKDGNPTSLATGFVVGKHAIATAAHVVTKYNFGGVSTPIPLYCIKFFDEHGEVERILKASAKKVNMTYHVPEAYLNESAPIYDYAVITVSYDLSEYQCFDLGYVRDSLIGSESSNVFVTGFPDEVGGNTVNTYDKDNMYTGKGKLLSPSVVREDASNDLIYYDVDTSGGNSGGPIYIEETVRGKTFYTAIGSIVDGDRTDPYTYNFGVRYNSDILKFYKGNPNIQ